MEIIGGKKFYSKAEKAEYVLKCGQSGQSRKAFARSAGLNYGAFKRWFYQQLTAGGRAPSPSSSSWVPPAIAPVPSFVSLEVEPTSPVREEGVQPSVEITFSNGSTLRFYQSLPAGYLKELLK